MKQVVFAALALATAGAGAQQVYRCGSSYSQQPCPGGSAVEAGDPRTAQDAAQSRAAAQSDAKRADAMEKTRLAQEKAAPKAVVMGPKEAASAPAKTVEKKKAKGKEPEHFTAAVPGSAKKK